MILGTEPFEVCGSDGEIRASSRSNNHITSSSHINSSHNARAENTQPGFPTLGKLKAEENNANTLKQSGDEIPIFNSPESHEVLLILMLLYQQLDQVFLCFSFFTF